jgi:hypothetical protein
MVLVALAAWPAAASAKLVVDDPEAKQVTAAPGILVYVGMDDLSRDRLLRQRGAKVRALRARPTADIRDVDAGTNRKRRRVLVYTHCGDPLNSLSCHIYSFDFRRNRNSRLKGLSRHRCGEYGASMYRGTLAFLRTGSKKRCKPGVWIKRPRHKAKRISRRHGGATDLTRGRIVLDARRKGKPTVEVMSTRGKTRVLARFRRAGSGDDLLDPLLSGRYVYWAERDAISADAEDGPVFRVRRRALSGKGRTRAVKLPTTGYTGFALRKGRLIYSAFSDTDPGGVFSFKPHFR